MGDGGAKRGRLGRSNVAKVTWLEVVTVVWERDAVAGATSFAVSEIACSSG